MRFIDFGSLNFDHVYRLSHLVRKGETIAAASYQRNEGGKGFNQAVALAKAGQQVHFAGAIGPDGTALKVYLEKLGIHTECLMSVDIPTGHAVIQVDDDGDNSIVLYGGANRSITREMIEGVLDRFEQGDVLLMQNEISGGAIILEEAARRGLRIVLNPSPMAPEIMSWPLEYVEWFILNEVEAGDMTGEEEPHKMLDALLRTYPHSHFVLTMGEAGAICASDGRRIYQPAIRTTAVDSTAAGDTFTGYFLYAMLNGKTLQEAIRLAACAASITVSRPGAAVSIPVMEELEKKWTIQK